MGSRTVGWDNPARGARWIRGTRRPAPLASRLLHRELGAGESEALALAAQHQPSLLIVDDVAARAVAQTLGLRYTGTLGILLKAKSAHLIPAVRPLLDQLIQHTFYLSEPLYRATLSLARE